MERLVLVHSLDRQLRFGVGSSRRTRSTLHCPVQTFSVPILSGGARTSLWVVAPTMGGVEVGGGARAKLVGANLWRTYPPLTRRPQSIGEPLGW